MTDRSILFSGPMVRALLDGTKTQTRRILKPQPTVPFSAICRDAAGVYTGDEWGEELERLRVPHAPGNRLWVRETWAFDVNAIGSMRDEDGPFVYAADPSGARTRLCERWTPSIHMPRWASRLTLIVTDVRVQRLHDISEDDAIAEGIEEKEFFGCPCWKIYGDPDGTVAPDDPIASFASLWDHCHGPGAWDVNPWVVATTFTVHHCNIDTMEAPR